MSISAKLALSSCEVSKEDILEAMPGLNYDRWVDNNINLHSFC